MSRLKMILYILLIAAIFLSAVVWSIMEVMVAKKVLFP